MALLCLILALARSQPAPGGDPLDRLARPGDDLYVPHDDLFV